MTYLVTGASGQLGRLVVESLLARGVAAGDVVATARDTSTIADLADRGVVVRRADYDDPASLKEAFAGIDRVLLVSSSEVGRRVAQHRNVIDAAADAGVELLAYTSIAGADSSTLILAGEHQETEQYLRESVVPFALLRNSWYVENWTAQLQVALTHGTVVGAAGQGRVSAATRADYAEAAAAVLTAPDQAGAVHELGGTPFTLAEYAEAVSRVAGAPVTYTDLPTEEYAAVLVSAGLPEPVAAAYADGDRGVRDGELLVTSGDLERLTGRPSTPLEDAIRAALA